ncbi:MAG: SDR family oxidoreductase [Nocardioides sp.]|uniref:SDR family NAD(P)-dependent oxidoreductase n=1 Tax=Nocardioides sp. TaxID=35761 RepID=UPI0039E53EAD
MSRRHVVVVGGAGAIGRGIVAALAADGVRVSVADLDQPAGAPDPSDILPGTHVVALDVTDREAVLAALGPRPGVGSYDALVFAAGTNCTGPVASTDWSAYERVMAVNLRGAFHVGQALALNLEAAPRPCSAVFLSSTAGLRGEGGASVYAASKFGVRGFVECLASEVAAFGGRVNSVCPGNIDSPMLRTLAAQVAEREQVGTEAMLRQFADATAFGRLIGIDEVAAVVAFLAGDGSTGMSGQTVVVDGPPR